MARAALDIVLGDPEKYVMADEERADFQRLAVFLGEAAANPAAFPVTGEMATRVRSIVRRAKGPAQPQGRKNRRKLRQEKRQGFAKRRRAERRGMTEAYNAALTQYEAETEEAREAQAALEARIASQPKYNVVAENGQVILAEIPAEFIKPVEADQPEITRGAIHLPASVEAALERERQLVELEG